MSIEFVSGVASEYTLGADSQPQDGVPKGAVMRRTQTPSRIYPGTTYDYWVYVPAQYTASAPACAMVFQDGWAYVHPDGPVRAPTVFDNLIHQGDMPVTVGVFVDPGRKEAEFDQRDVQYTPLNDTYARFLLDEVLAEVGRDVNLDNHASARAVVGMSDGGLAAFTAAWQRPNAFSKVVSHVGSYTRLGGGSEYPFRIRQTRGNPKPIRVFLQDGENDINITEGNWTLANLEMESALMFARYDYRFVLGKGGHDLSHGGAIFPDTLRWLWRDHPDLRCAEARLDDVAGEWDVVTNVLGLVWRSRLTVTVERGALTATLASDDEGALEVTAVALDGDVLRYEYVAPQSQLQWGKGTTERTMRAWVKVAGGEFRGALTSASPVETDYTLKGRRR